MNPHTYDWHAFNNETSRAWRCQAINLHNTRKLIIIVIGIFVFVTNIKFYYQHDHDPMYHVIVIILKQIIMAIAATTTLFSSCLYICYHLAKKVALENHVHEFKWTLVGCCLLVNWIFATIYFDKRFEERV